MDKNEQKLKLEEIKRALHDRDYEEAGKIADALDIKKIKDNNLLNIVANAYELNHNYEKAKEVLLTAYENTNTGRHIAYKLCLLSIKTKDFTAAKDYYEDFVEMAPRDTSRFVLKYKMAKAQEKPLEELIGILEEYVNIDMEERWAYELAKLYHIIGDKQKCIDICDEICLWFAEGKYVFKAMDLKKMYSPLTPAQQEKYDENKKKIAMEAEAAKKHAEELKPLDVKMDIVHDIPEIKVEPQTAEEDIQAAVADSVKEILADEKKEQSKMAQNKETEDGLSKTRIFDNTASGNLGETKIFPKMNGDMEEIILKSEEDDLNNKTIEELHNLLVSKEISATELTQATIDDIKAREEAVNAFVTVAEEAALAQAKAIDEKGIDADNLLSGIPFAVKDNISTDGILTTAASKMLYNYEPIFDATAVANAKAKDMIVIGKTNMDEFAMGGSGETSYYGSTKNAWDHSKVPGGSSSGSAAAVASGQVRLSLGSDTGGSIRQPAAFNGIVGLKPTYGTVSRFGLIAFGSSLDQIGTFSQTVKENAQLLNVIASEDAKDSTSAPVRIADFTSKIGQDIKSMKIALPKEYLGEGIDPEVKETILDAAKHFEKLGATVEEVSLPHSKYGVAVYYIIASSEASSNLQRFDGIRYGFRAEDAKNLDDIYVNTRSQGFGDEVKRRIMLGTFSLSSGYYDAYYKKAGQVRTLIIQDFEKVFADYDLILGPTAPSVAFDLDTLNHDPVAMYLADLLTIPVNLAGLPGISIPAGFAQGLPVGLQLIGPKYSEETIYQAAAAFEATTDYHKQQPVIFGGDN